MSGPAVCTLTVVFNSTPLALIFRKLPESASYRTRMWWRCAQWWVPGGGTRWWGGRGNGWWDMVRGMGGYHGTGPGVPSALCPPLYHCVLHCITAPVPLSPLYHCTGPTVSHCTATVPLLSPLYCHCTTAVPLYHHCVHPVVPVPPRLHSCRHPPGYHSRA